MKRNFLAVAGLLGISLALFPLLDSVRYGVVRAQNGTILVNLTTSASYQYHILKHPTGIWVGKGLFDSCLSSQYQLFLSDTDNHVIRTFRPGGSLTTVAGTGSPGSSDGAPLSSQFNRPTGIFQSALTYFQPPRGCAYVNSVTFMINDSANFKIRQLYLTTSTGSVSTPYGNGVQGYVNSTPASSEFAHHGGGVTVTSGQLVADAENHVVRLAAPSGVTTVAGSGVPGFVDGQGAAAKFAFPTKITWDSTALKYYISDTGNNAIRAMDSNGNVTTVAGGGNPGYVDGPASSAKFNWPTGSVMWQNALYVADTGNNVIRKIDLATKQVSTYAGLGPSSGLVDGALSQAKFHTPTDIAISGDHLYFFVSDTMNNAIRRIDIGAAQVSTYIN